MSFDLAELWKSFESAKCRLKRHFSFAPIPLFFLSLTVVENELVVVVVVVVVVVHSVVNLLQ